MEQRHRPSVPGPVIPLAKMGRWTFRGALDFIKHPLEGMIFIGSVHFGGSVIGGISWDEIP